VAQIGTTLESAVRDAIPGPAGKAVFDSLRTGALAFSQAADVVALTDNSTGTGGATLAAGVGISTLSTFVNLADILAADLVTTWTPGYKFKILSVDFVVTKAATTGSKAATLTPKISGVAVTGGVLALTSGNCTPQGVVVAGTTVTAANTGSAAATISITGSAVTAFVEGNGTIEIRIQNMDTADAIASLALKCNTIRSGQRTAGQMA
jgi:hypothetical protein